MGLVSEEMTDHLEGWVETLAFAVGVFWPDYAIILPNTAWDWMTQQWWFEESYQSVTSIENVEIYRLVKRPQMSYTTVTMAEFISGVVLTEVGFSSSRLTPGMNLDLQLHFEVHRNQPSPYIVTVSLIDTHNGDRLALTNLEPFYGGYPADAWQPGDKLALPARVSVPSDLAPGTYRLGVILYDPKRGGSVPFTTAPSAEFSELKTGWLRAGQPPVPERAQSLETLPKNALWRGGIELEEIAISKHLNGPATIVPVRLLWHATQSMARDLTVFVHFIDSRGEIFSQEERKPLDGRFPTPSWHPGERFEDLYSMLLPEDLPIGTYGLRIGIYDEEGHLMLANDSGDSLLLPNLWHVKAD
jgi:hypothetical protein